jgi:glutaredoxin
MSTVRFLTRRVCRICAEARPIVEHRARRTGHEFEVVDVDETGLADEFGDRVPVVLLDGVEVLSGRFTTRDVRRAVK